jgi:hypothetical protein
LFKLRQRGFEAERGDLGGQGVGGCGFGHDGQVSCGNCLERSSVSSYVSAIAAQL